jgi:hypothetical protein
MSIMRVGGDNNVPAPEEDEVVIYGSFFKAGLRFPLSRFVVEVLKLVHETKAMSKEQYHNNFGCYGFIAHPNTSYTVPTFRKRWPRAWMEEWLYVKNDLKEREDIKEVIMRPIWSRFGLRRPKVEIDKVAKACQKAFGTVCFFIATRDLIQEHIAFRVWPLVENWEMPKITVAESSEGELVRLKYTFRYGDKFDEPNDDWLKCMSDK